MSSEDSFVRAAKGNLVHSSASSQPLTYLVLKGNGVIQAGVTLDVSAERTVKADKHCWVGESTKIWAPPSAEGKS